ncbi:MAG: hypothetical protein Q9223_005865 [Gallowayella weberi]
MKLTIVFAVLAAEVALAAPVAQQAPVPPNPQPDCLPDGFYPSQAGIPGSACCSGYFANNRCQPRPPHLLVKDAAEETYEYPDYSIWSDAFEEPLPTPQPTEPVNPQPTHTLNWSDYPIPTFRLSDFLGPTNALDPRATEPSTPLDTHVPISFQPTEPAVRVPTFVPGFPFPHVPFPVSSTILPTLTGPSTQLDTHEPVPVAPQTTPSLSTFAPIPVGTEYPLSQYGLGFSHSLAHTPFPTTPSVTNDKRAVSAINHHGPPGKFHTIRDEPGFSHTIPHTPLPTTFATLVPKSVDETS